MRKRFHLFQQLQVVEKIKAYTTQNVDDQKEL